MQLDDTGAKVLPALSNLAVRDPSVLWLVRLGDGVPRAPSQAVLSGVGGGGGLEEVVEGLVLGAESLEERALLEAPMAVDGGAVGALGAGKGEGVGRAGRGRRGERLDVRLGLASGGSHGCVRDGGVREDAQTQADGNATGPGATRLYLEMGAGAFTGGSEQVRASVYRLAAGRYSGVGTGNGWRFQNSRSDEGRRGGKGEEAEEGMGAQQTCRPDGFERKDACRVRGGRLLFELGTGSAVRRAGDSAACGRRVRLQRRVQPTTAPPSHPWHRQCWGTLMPPPL